METTQQSINEIFEGVYLEVDGKELPVNVVGIMQQKSSGRRFVILTDMPGLIEEDEYMIAELIEDEEGLSFADVGEDLLEELSGIIDSYMEAMDE